MPFHLRFPGLGKPPIHENLIHIFDRDSTGSYTLEFELAPLLPVAVQQVGQPIPVHRTAPLDAVEVTFTRPIDAASLGADDLKLFRNGVLVPISGPLPKPDDEGGGTYRIKGLQASTQVFGDYVLVVSGAGILDPFGNPAAPGEAQTSWTMGEPSPYVRIVRGVAPDALLNRPVDHLIVEFAFSVDEATFGVDDLELRLDGGENLLTNTTKVRVYPVKDDKTMTRFYVTGLDDCTQADGDYAFTVFAAGVRSPGGTAGIGSYDLRWTADGTGPSAVVDAAFVRDQSITLSATITNALRGHVVGTVTHPEEVVLASVFDATTGQELGRAEVTGARLSVPIELAVPGAHDLRVRLIDQAGNVTESDPLPVFVDRTPPSVEGITGYPPRPDPMPVDELLIRYSEVVDVGSLSLAEFLLSRDGVVLPPPSRALQPDGRTVRLSDLPTQKGVYTLVVKGGGITDEAGNIQADDTSVTWATGEDVRLADRVPPVSEVRALPKFSLAEFVVRWSGSDIGGATAAFDVYVREDGGAYRVWLSDTTLTETTFRGELGRAYAFYTVARDAAGNAEPAPATPDAVTTVRVNQPPAHQLPGTQLLFRNGALVFSPSAGNAIRVSDADSGTSPLVMKLTVPQGRLLIKAAGGLTLVSGNNTRVLKLTGSAAALNAALRGLTYRPAAGFVGKTALTLETSDQGHTGAGGPLTRRDTVSILVRNRRPVALARRLTYTVFANQPLRVAPANGLLSWARDPDRDALRVVVLVRPAAGSLRLLPGGGFVYEPAGGFTGSSTFTVRYFDGLQFSAPIVVELRVRAKPVVAPVPTGLDGMRLQVFQRLMSFVQSGPAGLVRAVSALLR